MNFKTWFMETRPQFLILCVVLALLGTSLAWYHGSFNLGYALLGFFGLLLTHISVNTLNDYCDFRSGVDLAVQRTPFSGGSGILPAAALTQKQVLSMSIICLAGAFFIGIYFITVTGIALLPLLIVAAACVIFYTRYILKIHWPEWAAGLGLGTLPILGAYFIQSTVYTLPAIIIAIPSGILVHNLLLINEFPDMEADKIAHRKTLPIVLGKKKAGIVFSILTVLVYVWIAGCVIARIMPVYSLLGLLTVPFAVKAIKGALHPDDMSKLVPAMANNVLVVLLTQLLMGIGLILGKVL